MNVEEEIRLVSRNLFELRRSVETLQKRVDAVMYALAEIGCALTFFRSAETAKIAFDKSDG